MKRFLFLLLTMALLAALLAGCAGNRSAYPYPGNVSTTEDGRVNGSNDAMSDRFTQDRANNDRETAARSKSERSKNRTERSDNTADPRRPGWTSGTGADSAWDAKRPAARTGRIPAAK